MRFIETPVFSAAVRRALDDESLRALQVALVQRPTQGLPIPGSHGLRKLRWAVAGRGKRGGLRIIYYWDPASEAFYMLFAYLKQEQGDLAPAQIRSLARLVREEFG